jgi:uncharacterized protein YndB with AHSA1/START domain
MAIESSTPARTEDLTLHITRVFDAPRALVFRAWTDPNQLVRWWGPRGFSLPSCKLDSHPGGSFRYQMRGPDGDDHYMQGVFREIVEPERIVFAGCWTDAEGNPRSPETVATVTFEDQGGKTRLTLHQSLFESVTARDEHHGGWNSSFDCLADYLAAA